MRALGPRDSCAARCGAILHPRRLHSLDGLPRTGPRFERNLSGTPGLNPATPVRSACVTSGVR